MLEVIVHVGDKVVVVNVTSSHVLASNLCSFYRQRGEYSYYRPKKVA